MLDHDQTAAEFQALRDEVAKLQEVNRTLLSSMLEAAEAGASLVVDARTEATELRSVARADAADVVASAREELRQLGERSTAERAELAARQAEFDQERAEIDRRRRELTLLDQRVQSTRLGSPSERGRLRDRLLALASELRRLADEPIPMVESQLGASVAERSSAAPPLATPSAADAAPPPATPSAADAAPPVPPAPPPASVVEADAATDAPSRAGPESSSPAPSPPEAAARAAQAPASAAAVEAAAGATDTSTSDAPASPRIRPGRLIGMEDLPEDPAEQEAFNRFFSDDVESEPSRDWMLGGE